MGGGFEVFALLGLGFEHVLVNDGGHSVDAVLHLPHMLDGGSKQRRASSQGLFCHVQEALGSSLKQELEWHESCQSFVGFLTL